MEPAVTLVLKSLEVVTVSAVVEPNAIVPMVVVPVDVVSAVPAPVPNPVIIVPIQRTMAELPAPLDVPAVRTVTDALRNLMSEMNERPPEVPFAPAVLMPNPNNCRVKYDA